MRKDDKQISHRYDINVILDKIVSQIPQIIPSKIELFTEVFYPIAILEVSMTETTFEDFDIVQMSVLRFIREGVLGANEIAFLTGLKASYIQKIIDLMMGYGYINNEGLTESGINALNTEKKKSTIPVKQRFKADALTGEILKLDIQPCDADIMAKEKTGIIIPHIPHVSGITVESINNQLMESDLNMYKEYNREVLNSNVEMITDITCIDLEYIKAYLIKLQGIDSPFVISYRHNPKEMKYKKRFTLQPIKMPCRKAYDEYGFDKDIECYSDEAMAVINDLYHLICKKITRIDDESIKKMIDHMYHFDYEYTDVTLGRILDGIPEQIQIYVNDKSFTEWKSFVLSFLENYDPYRGYMCTHSALNGLFLRIESQNPQIRKAANEYQSALRQYNPKRLKNYIKEQLFQKRGEGDIAHEAEGFHNIEILDIIDVIKMFKTRDSA